MGSEAKLKILIGRERIETVVNRLAAEINRDYQGQELLLIGVLTGAFIFLADLVRLLKLSLEVDFIDVSSYGECRESSGQIKVVKHLSAPIVGRQVLVVEDIVDTGLTAAFLVEYLAKKRPASLKLCTLLDKPSRRKVPLTIDYIGITMPDKFVVGYGLDCGGKYRHLPDIYFME